MVTLKYLGLKKLSNTDVEDIQWVTDFYKPKIERRIKSGALTVSVKGSHLMGKVGRFTIKLLVASPDGRFHTEQSGWGLIKTARRSFIHMENLLGNKIRKEVPARKTRKPSTERSKRKK